MLWNRIDFYFPFGDINSLMVATRRATRGGGISKSLTISHISTSEIVAKQEGFSRGVFQKCHDGVNGAKEKNGGGR